jgi:NADH dehydrogenase
VAEEPEGPSVVVVGGGFAGVSCAVDLAKKGVRVTLIDKNNYHQFQPLLYQLATAQISRGDLAQPLRGILRKHPSADVKQARVVAVDPEASTVTTEDGHVYRGDYLVLAMGSQPNFFNTPGAAEHTFPLYTMDDAVALRTRMISLLEAADDDPSLLAKGALNFVIIGAGPTGVETAGALAELIHAALPVAYRDLPPGAVSITLADLGHSVLGAFSDKAHDYAAKALQKDGVVLKLGVGATEITADKVVFSDGSEILTKLVVWAGGIKAPDLAGASGLTAGRGGRLTTEPDLTVPGHPHVYALGDTANIAGADGELLPQLGSVAQQSGQWAAANILADIEQGKAKPFHYKDKGIMAMIGRRAAVAEVGPHRHELHGSVAFASWLGVHAMLLSSTRQQVNAFISWGWDYFAKSREGALLDEDEAGQIDWGDDDGEAEPLSSAAPPTPAP